METREMKSTALELENEPGQREEKNIKAVSGVCECEDTRIHRLCIHKLTLSDTTEAMSSLDYRERFIAEYVQTKIRYEKLKAFNTRIEAARRTACSSLCIGPAEPRKVAEMPKHDCPEDLLLEQQSVMGEYLHILETRAVIEGIDLTNY